MPAYRSEAEAEVRGAVVDRLREICPKARIIHEINACGFGNRIDVLAVDEAEITAVEIKSEKDKIDRLPAQITAMKGVAHHVIAALHEKFLVEQETNEFAAHECRNGTWLRGSVPDEARGATTWIFPERNRCIGARAIDRESKWYTPDRAVMQVLPRDAIHMLWRDELAELCRDLGTPAHRRATMREMVRALLWNHTGKELTRGICAALRRRDCIEADPAIECEAVA